MFYPTSIFALYVTSLHLFNALLHAQDSDVAEEKTRLNSGGQLDDTIQLKNIKKVILLLLVNYMYLN